MSSSDWLRQIKELLTDTLREINLVLHPDGLIVILFTLSSYRVILSATESRKFDFPKKSDKICQCQFPNTNPFLLRISRIFLTLCEMTVKVLKDWQLKNRLNDLRLIVFSYF